MIYVESPAEWDGDRPAVFLAGGITGCVDWQKEVVAGLADLDIAVLNPRRENFPIGDPTAARDQIEWEFRHLRKAQAVSFWFPAETLCPIVLYELGSWIRTSKKLFVGVHPDYKRKQDVEIQTTLVRPKLEIVYSVADLIAQIREHFA